VGVDVVVGGQLAGADLHDLAVVVRLGGALEVDELELEGFVLQLLARGVEGGVLAADEPLLRLDDLAHRLLEGLEVLGGEGLLDGEVVVEPVGHRRPDTELGVRELLLHGLREHVRGAVADDRPAVLGVRRHRVDVDVGVGAPREVLEGPVGGAHDDDRLRTVARQAGVPDGLARRRPRADPDGGGGGGRCERGHGGTPGSWGLAGGGSPPPVPAYRPATTGFGAPPRGWGGSQRTDQARVIMRSARP
jgi:hypothetical protein